MSGSSYPVSCPKCNAENNARGKAMTLAMTCKSCNTYFRIGNWNKDLTKFGGPIEPAIPIGSKGKIDGTLYEVLGFAVKKETKYHYSWREYFLFNPFMGYAFLSEYNGHWNIIWPIEDNPNKGVIDDEFFYNENHFRLYQKYSAQVTYARGEFFFDVVDLTESTVNKEFIAPPYLFAVEQNEDSLLWCEGEYLKRDEVATAFNIPVSKLPGKSGIGYTQPIATSFKQESLVKFTIVLALVIIAIQIFFSNTATEQTVYQGRFYQADLKDQKFFVTPSFDLEGSSKSVEIGIEAPVNNDWFFGEFSLINETTGMEYNFTKEIEYYHGVDGGESWTEGSSQGWAFVSEIPGGRYHLNIYPEFSLNSHEFSIIVKRDVATMANFFFAFGALALFPIGYFIRKRILEQRRWSESDYSPYDT